jgi:hypothetical protein
MVKTDGPGRPGGLHRIGFVIRPPLRPQRWCSAGSWGHSTCACGRGRRCRWPLKSSSLHLATVGACPAQRQICCRTSKRWVPARNGTGQLSALTVETAASERQPEVRLLHVATPATSAHGPCRGFTHRRHAGGQYSDIPVYIDGTTFSYAIFYLMKNKGHRRPSGLLRTVLMKARCRGHGAHASTGATEVATCDHVLSGTSGLF